ncbi:MAG: Asp-tRNA(Asn)/Glu-tRNA(Gln) amidotransferase GatCAB subunit C [Candidatus Chloroheliales bacterium]|nr:MAG: Asp-tRNA(Asn)/Glu-tRNA(Gln) amidotransferase GatCAB subunit C [Chloroflexota bacterium]
MALTREEVAHVAYLARLGMSEAEIDVMAEQLSAVLGYIEKLNQVDTSEVPPTALSVNQNVLRPDLALPSLPREQALANAPQRVGDYIRVGVILDAIGEAEVES